ncbi:unnamed protein product [Ectocarpus sp. 8 AP-2014]
MVHLSTSKCAHSGCNKRPSFGVEGSTRTEFCSPHKKAGMVNVGPNKCAHHGCNKRPSFGVDGSTKREFCFTHKKASMVNISGKCAHDGCNTQPSFGVEGSTKREYCFAHKGHGMVNIRSGRYAQIHYYITIVTVVSVRAVCHNVDLAEICEHEFVL